MKNYKLQIMEFKKESGKWYQTYTKEMQATDGYTLHEKLKDMYANKDYIYIITSVDDNNFEYSCPIMIK